MKKAIPDVLSEPTRMLAEMKGTELGGLAEEAFWEFSDVGDYIWKSPRLIENETESELEKLEAYFPFKGEPESDAFAAHCRKARWHLESRRLGVIFPRHMAIGNFFAAVSLFEFYFLKICKLIEKRSSLSLSTAAGQGTEKLFGYMKNVGIDFRDSTFREPVFCALDIRNVLFHANGVIAWSRKPKEIERLVKARTYLAKDARQIRELEPCRFPDIDNPVTVVNSEFGPQVRVTNHYAHIASAYMRNFIVDLCYRASKFGQVEASLAQVKVE